VKGVRAIRVDPAPTALTGELGQLVVCIPTYNELENIEPMLRAQAEVLGGFGHVIVIDDGSPDGTADVAERVGQELGCVTVLRRTSKDGLGPAYLAGFRAALERGADLVVQMDCDFSHDPADLLRIVPTARDFDLVLGSRAVAGGRVVNWPRRRIALSRLGSAYARLLLGVGVQDVTAGFKCYRRSVLEAIPFEQVLTSGYGFNIELTYRAISAGARVAEVPITFTERTAGVSKMNGRIALEAIRQVPSMRLQAWRARRRGR
jgi:dolichol-phosphate mannosyltransferase